VTGAVFYAAGKLIETLVDNEHRMPDEHRIEYRPRGSSCVYFVRLKTGGQARHTKLVL
jgi:hypothetical protein